MAGERGQVAVGVVVGLGLLTTLVAILAGAFVSAGPAAWTTSAEDRALARERILGTSADLRPIWRGVRRNGR